MTNEIDGILKEWGDRLFYPKVKGKKARSTYNIMGGKKETSVKPLVQNVRLKLKLTTKKTPEVMVKITGSNKNCTGILNHFDYISRNGQVEVENEMGEKIMGKKQVHEVMDEWKYGGYAIPETGEKKREAFNIVFSMPEGTDRTTVRNAVRDTAREEFSGHQYVFAEHDDELHPHVHLCVKAVSLEGVRLNPRKADQRRWRERFAEKLREHGVEANATARMVRSNPRKVERQEVLHIEKTGRESTVRAKEQQTTKKIAPEAKELHKPVYKKLTESRKQVIDAYKHMAIALAKSAHAEDRTLALNIVDFIKDMQPLKTVHEQALEARVGMQKHPSRDDKIIE